MNLSCPHCSKPVQHRPELAGSPVRCPHCRETFNMPHLGLVQSPQLPAIPEEQQPRIVVVNQPAPRTYHEPRLEAGGWFARAFSTTMGVVVALFVFFVVMPICLLLVIGAIGFVAAPRQPVEPTTVVVHKKVLKPSGPITRAKYDSIEAGMTLPQVAEIFGVPGRHVSTTEIGPVTKEVIRWQNPSATGCVITFEDGQVIEKRQSGLE